MSSLTMQRAHPVKATQPGIVPRVKDMGLHRCAAIPFVLSMIECCEKAAHTLEAYPWHQMHIWLHHAYLHRAWLQHTASQKTHRGQCAEDKTTAGAHTHAAQQPSHYSSGIGHTRVLCRAKPNRLSGHRQAAACTPPSTGVAKQGAAPYNIQPKTRVTVAGNGSN